MGFQVGAVVFEKITSADEIVNANSLHLNQLIARVGIFPPSYF